MPQGQLDQIVIGCPNGFIELELEHIVLLDFHRILDGQYLLFGKFQPGKVIHEGSFARADWTRKKVESSSLDFLRNLL